MKYKQKKGCTQNVEFVRWLEFKVYHRKVDGVNQSFADVTLFAGSSL